MKLENILSDDMQLWWPTFQRLKQARDCYTKWRLWCFLCGVPLPLDIQHSSDNWWVHQATHKRFECRHLAPEYPTKLANWAAKYLCRSTVHWDSPGESSRISSALFGHCWMISIRIESLRKNGDAHKPLFDPIQNVILKLRQPKYIIRLFNPLHWMSRFDGHLVFFVIFCQLTVGQESLVGHAIPSGVIWLINAIVRIQFVLKVRQPEWMTLNQCRCRTISRELTQKLCTAGKCVDCSLVRLKCV